MRQYLWRLVAGLIFIGSVAEFGLGLLLLMGIKRTISFGALQAIYWIPPAIERPSSFLQVLSRLDLAIAWTVLVVNLILSWLLAYGLWKEKLWAGCLETALTLYPGVVLVNIWWRYFAADHAHGLNDFFMVGNGPALLWVLIIIALLWTDQLFRLSAKWKGDDAGSAQSHLTP